MSKGKETTLTPHNVSDITAHLARHGIVALIWGEMGVLGAYSSQLVPIRLFLIVTDFAFTRTRDILQRELGLRPRSEYSLPERSALPLSGSYSRFSLAAPRSVLSPEPTTGSLSKSYLQLFKASDVGLDGAAWTNARLGSLDSVTSNGQKTSFLVPDPSAFLQVSAYLYRKIFYARSEYKHHQVSGAFAWIRYILRQCLAVIPEPDLLEVTADNADIAGLLCKGFAPSLVDLEQRWHWRQDSEYETSLDRSTFYRKQPVRDWLILNS